MKFFKSLAIAAVGAAVLVSGASAQTARTVKIATEGAYPPWNILQPDGKLAGFEIDLANTLCERAKLKCQIIAQDWDGLIPGLEVGKYDAIMAGMSITEERLKAIAFSAPYAQEPNGFIAEKTGPLANLPGTGKVINLDKDEAENVKAFDALKPLLKGKALGVQISTTHALLSEKYLKNAVEVKQYKSTPEHDLDLAAGRIDLVLADRSTLTASLATSDLKNYGMTGPMFVGGIVGKGVGIGMRKNETDLKKTFDDAIKAAIADGTVKALSEKWFKADNTPRN